MNTYYIIFIGKNYKFSFKQFKNFYISVIKQEYILYNTIKYNYII